MKMIIVDIGFKSHAQPCLMQKQIMLGVAVLFQDYLQDNSSKICGETMSEEIQRYFNRCATFKFAGEIQGNLKQFKRKSPHKSCQKYHSSLTNSYEWWKKQPKCPSCEKQMPEKGKDIDMSMRLSYWGVKLFMTPKSKKDLTDSINRMKQLLAQFQQVCQKYLPEKKKLLILQQVQAHQDEEDNQEQCLVKEEHIELKYQVNPSLKKEEQECSMKDEYQEKDIKKQKMKQKKAKKQKEKKEEKEKSDKKASSIEEKMEDQRL